MLYLASFEVAKKTMSFKHLHAMGIQSWRLKAKTYVSYLIVSDEESTLSEQGEQLLNGMLASIELSKEQVLTSTALKQQIGTLQPSVILILGKLAAHHLLNCDTSIEDLRGKFHAFENTPILVTYHPAHLLQYPKNKREAYKDLCMLQNILSF